MVIHECGYMIDVLEWYQSYGLLLPDVFSWVSGKNTHIVFPNYPPEEEVQEFLTWVFLEFSKLDIQLDIYKKLATPFVEYVIRNYWLGFADINGQAFGGASVVVHLCPLSNCQVFEVWRHISSGSVLFVRKGKGQPLHLMQESEQNDPRGVLCYGAQLWVDHAGEPGHFAVEEGLYANETHRDALMGALVKRFGNIEFS